MAAIDLGCDARQTDFGFGDNAVRLLVAILISYYPGLKLDPQPQVVCAWGFLILNWLPCNDSV